MPQPSPNFAFLQEHDATLVVLGTLAENYFRDDPSTSLFKLRQFGELLAKYACAKLGIYAADQDNQLTRLQRLRDEARLSPEVLVLFHLLRRSGNEAVHQIQGTHREALSHLKVARELGVWFHRTFARRPDFKPGSFVPPQPPRDESAALSAELASLRESLAQAQASAESERQRRETAESRVLREAQDRVFAEAYAQELEERAGAIESELAQAQQQALAAAQQPVLIQAAQEAAKHIVLDESETRRIIDQQLRDAGWEVDTQTLRHSEGVRPQKGKNLAIAEWPTATGPVDYVLFCGLTAFATVEAKRESKNVPSVLIQAERYAEGLKAEPEQWLEGSPWTTFKVPFAFATNGRPFVHQLGILSGIWFRDLRRSDNIGRPLLGWYTPQGIQELLKQDRAQAQAQLKTESFDYGFTLRDFQIKAIQAVELALEDETSRSLLLAMATGTGKTKTAIALLYRLLKTKRFRRALFLVDRNALGEQAGNAFKETRMESLQTFADIFGIKELEDTDADSETRVHIATIQAMVGRVLDADDPSQAPPVDQYDLIVVDECHRGYTLDRELSDQEQRFRSFDDYVSKYRRVLDHFDAVKVGLTATPALHTTQIFGAPTFHYGYREAVVDGHLVDYLPPWRITTRLSDDGLMIARGAPIQMLQTRTGHIISATAPDQFDFEIEDFNRTVLAEGFNRAICGELAKHIDPTLPGKTLIFCVNDLHAELVTQVMKEALESHYGSVDDAAVQKITGQADKPLQRLRTYKNEKLPSIAVTVDLLTTGVDVPEIVNLVFLRRVNSRILFDQMMGRATRLCPEIGKTAFQVFDAVNQFDHLEDFSDMRPVVANPKITFAQLAMELAGSEDPEDQALIREQLQAKVQRKLQGMTEDDRQTLADLTGQPAPAWLHQLRTLPPGEGQTWAQTHSQVLSWLDRLGPHTEPYVLLDQSPDEVREMVHAFTDGKAPVDYLEGFKQFVQASLNEVPALLAVAQRPRSLTRKDLKAVKQLLDAKGYSEAGLRTAYADLTNEDIAAGILGHIRQAALGDHLIPYEHRVQHALEGLLKSHAWTAPQRDWLRRIGKQLLQETVVDREALSQGAFETAGGFERINKVFDGRLEQILGDLQDAIWKPTG